MSAQQAHPGGQWGRLPSGAPWEPAPILALLDQALADPGVTLSRLRFLRHVLDNGQSGEDYAEEDVARMAGCPERAARDVKSWVSKFVPSMYVCSTLNEEVPENNIHGEAAFQLARKQLEEIGWGMLKGRQIKEPDAFIEEYGALNVLYALWCSRGKQVRNPAGFVTWWCRQGHQVPEGWRPMALCRQRHEDAVEEEAAPPAPETLPERPETPEELHPLWRDVLAYVEPQIRPGAFHAWIEPLSLVAVAEDATLILWAPDRFHAEWVKTRFADSLQRACQASGYRRYQLTWQGKKEQPSVAENTPAVKPLSISVPTCIERRLDRLGRRKSRIDY